MNYVIAIAGPTATGKTSLAISLAEKYKTVIVSADSRQMYRGMTIGTAKPTKEQLDAVKHHFINTLDVTDSYSAGQFEREAMGLINTLFDEHRLVFLVGGSGLYLRSVLTGFDDFPDIPEEVVHKWERRYAQDGLKALQDALRSRDTEYFGQVDIDNPRRLTRALSVIEYTGKPFSEFLARRAAERPFRAVRIWCNLDREQLYARINARVDQMIAAGLVDEARHLYPYRHQKALQTVGYQELFAYFDGQWDLDTAITKIKQHTRNYAKRQVTWFRNQGDWQEFNPPSFEDIDQYIQECTEI